MSERRLSTKTGSEPAPIAKATGLTTERVERVLNGDDVPVSDLVRVGGLLGVPTEELFA